MRPVGLAIIFDNSQGTVSTASTGYPGYTDKQITEDRHTQPAHLLMLPTVITSSKSSIFSYAYSAISNI